MARKRKTNTDCACYFAVFGDVHGHLRLVFELCRQWQLHNERHLSGIFACGDLGYFPNPCLVDRATARFARRDPEELGFAHYFASPEPPLRDPLLERTLFGDPADLNTVNCPLVFCHGNHEDFAELQRAANGPFCPVDVFDRVWYLRSGEVTELAGVRIAALGGKPEPPESAHEPLIGPTVSERAASKLLAAQFDILLAHGMPSGLARIHGSERLAMVISACEPAYCFYAHHRRPIPPGKIKRTECYWHDDVHFVPGGAVIRQCMGILRWAGPQDHQYKKVVDPWFFAYTEEAWRQACRAAEREAAS